MQKIDRLELELKRFREDVVEMLAEKDAEIKFLKEEIVFLRKGVSAVEERCDEAEAYERRDTIIVSGPEMPIARDGENSARVVCDVIKNKIGVVVRSFDISVAHRHGRKTQSQREDRKVLWLNFADERQSTTYSELVSLLKPPNLLSMTVSLQYEIQYYTAFAKRRRTTLLGFLDAVSLMVEFLRGSNKDSRIFIYTKLKFDVMCKDILNCEFSDLVENWPGC